MNASGPKLPEALAARFEVLGVQGEGGFGVVYRARQRDLGRLVAIKVLHPQFLDRDQVRERFQSEARVVSRLSHPGIVPALDFGIGDDAAYIVFPFVEGGSLRDRLDRGQLPWLEAFPHLLATLEALAYIHGEGVIHRDLKPENILLEGGAQALLTDFGISKPAGTTFHTGHGVLLGTPGYLPPEVMVGEVHTEQADVYAMGVIAWEMLCGRRPYEHPDDGPAGAPRAIVEEMRRSREGPPHAAPPGAEGLPADVDRLFDRLLAPRVAERFATAAEAVKACVDIAEGHSQTRAKMKRPRRASTGGRTLVQSRAPASVGPTTAGAGLRGAAERRRVVRLGALAAGALGAILLAGLGLVRFAPGPSAPHDSPAAVEPSMAHDVVGFAGSAAPSHRATVARLVAAVARLPVPMRPWGGNASGAGEKDCPLVISVPKVKQVKLRAEAGCQLVSVNGSIVNDTPGADVLVDASRFHRGLNWVRISCPDARLTAGLATVEPDAADARPVPPPPLTEAAQYDELRCIVAGDARDTLAAGRAYLEKTIAKDEGLMADVGNALIELNSEAAWNRRWAADQPGLVTYVEDSYWLESDTLALAVKMLDTVQRALARWPDRQVLWSNLGWVLRKSRQPEAGRVALVEALRLWPEAHWSWLELAQLERKLAETDGPRLVAPGEALAAVTDSVEYYDWAQKFFRSAGKGLPPKSWGFFVNYVGNRRKQVGSVVARARDAVRQSEKSP